MQTLWQRLAVAISTIPDFRDWAGVLVILVLYGAIALPIGFYCRFTYWRSPDISASAIIKVIATCLVMPAISEELFFRVLLLPHPIEKVSWINYLIWASVSLIAFIIYHPLEGLTFFKAGFTTFTNPIFLGLAALLGIGCTWSYFQSGSLWTAVFIHWVIVSCWLLLFGGYDRLNLRDGDRQVTN